MDKPSGSPEVLFPDIKDLFREYNQKYFEGYLDKCELEWSSRMTLCAGICYTKRRNGESKCTIRLSEPLLKFRPFCDTINTLLHEMIHAYIFAKFGGTLQRDGHGPDFLAVMHRINKAAGSSITVYHTFHAEVKACRVHVWRCQGPCQNRAPFYGWCRRSMNRPPQPADWWFANHQRTCGGIYVKVSEPLVEKKSPKKRAGPPENPYFKKLGKGRKLGGEDGGQRTMDDFTKSPSKTPTEACILFDGPNGPYGLVFSDSDSEYDVGDVVHIPTSDAVVDLTLSD